MSKITQRVVDDLKRRVIEERAEATATHERSVIVHDPARQQAPSQPQTLFSSSRSESSWG